MNESDMRSLIRATKARAGTWQALSDEWGLSVAYIHGVVNGQRPVSDAIAGRLGFRRVEQVVFEPIRESVE